MKLVKEYESGRLATAAGVLKQPTRPQWRTVMMFLLVVAAVLFLIAGVFNVWRF